MQGEGSAPNPTKAALYLMPGWDGPGAHALHSAILHSSSVSHRYGPQPTKHPCIQQNASCVGSDVNPAQSSAKQSLGGLQPKALVGLLSGGGWMRSFPAAQSGFSFPRWTPRRIQALCSVPAAPLQGCSAWRTGRRAQEGGCGLSPAGLIAACGQEQGVRALDAPKQRVPAESCRQEKALSDFPWLPWPKPQCANTWMQRARRHLPCSRTEVPAGGSDVGTACSCCFSPQHPAQAWSTAALQPLPRIHRTLRSAPRCAGDAVGYGDAWLIVIFLFIIMMNN